MGIKQNKDEDAAATVSAVDVVKRKGAEQILTGCSGVVSNNTTDNKATYGHLAT